MILVVDDDRAVLRSLERILMADGYAVTCCSTAHGALASIDANPPDAILLDLMMPAMNGREFLAALRDQLGRGDIPVLVITGVRGIDHNQALSMGASDVIEKPFELDELLNKIALVLFRTRDPGHEPLCDGERASGPNPATAFGYIHPGCGDTVLLLSADQVLADRVAILVEARGRRLLTLSRAMEELPRVVSVLSPAAVMVDDDLPFSDAGLGKTLASMDVLEALRGDPHLTHLPLMLVSCQADALDRVADRVRELAATSLLRPFDDHVLLSWFDAPPITAQGSSH